MVYEKAHHNRTKRPFGIEDAHHLTLNEDGKIRTWRVYFDANEEVAAYKDDLDLLLLEAVAHNDVERIKGLLDFGANPNTRDMRSGLTVLAMAAAQAAPDVVMTLLSGGADPLAVESRAGASVLHKACQGGSVQVVRHLLDAGAFVDSIAPTTGHTPLMEALWFAWPPIVELLLNEGAGLNILTHYGFTLKEHVAFELEANRTARDRIKEAERFVSLRQAADREAVNRQELMAAVKANDLVTARTLVSLGAEVDERYPRVNGFDDGHTPLLVAARDGRSEIVKLLLTAGADVNAVEPIFGAVPLHKAVYNGHLDITKQLLAQPGIDINFQGATNGYTPLHDALWHGYSECARQLVQAGARLDLRAHDGSSPLDIARHTLPNDPIITLIESHIKLRRNAR